MCHGLDVPIFFLPSAAGLTVYSANLKTGVAGTNNCADLQVSSREKEKHLSAPISGSNPIQSNTYRLFIRYSSLCEKKISSSSQLLSVIVRICFVVARFEFELT